MHPSLSVRDVKGYLTLNNSSKEHYNYEKMDFIGSLVAFC